MYNEGDVPAHETFNCQFDALFGEDCHDPGGHLHHIRQGKLGMGLVVSYLLKINWTNFPLDLIELKLEHLIGELKHLHEMPQLSFQHKAVLDFHSQQADKNDPPTSSTVGGDPNAPSSASAVSTPPNKHNITSVADNNSDGDDGIVDQPAQYNKKSVTLGNPQAINADGLLMDVDVQPVNDSSSMHEDKHQDVNNFFQMAVVKEVNGKSK
ncbi:hypothetical protein F5148DRAFT_1150803 [Russula earlei]|uniref:Uncharacterized protein n=1 Tax=Russula earlei TaxID=71964 RepID=A0ACC0U3Y3_9AGAM|nr:hypothetical protein F5148DRAFT_1150803 [Russula earlei]